MEEQYKYFSTQRPVDIGTFPKPYGNPPVKITNYDRTGRVWVENGTILAWGELIYDEPLTAREMAAYELKPSRYNPDVARTVHEQAQVIGAWEVKNNILEHRRLTVWRPNMGVYAAKEYVGLKELAERYKTAQQFPKVPSRSAKQAKAPRSGADRSGL